MLISITGTPGTGKTEVGKELVHRKKNVIFLTEFIEENDLFGEFDDELGSYDVDTKELDILLKEYKESDLTYYVEGHLSHFISSSYTIVIRCEPNALALRLEGRGYSEEKVKENVQAEILDIILCEADSTDIPIYELDSSLHTSEELVDSILEIQNGKKGYEPGKTDWTGEIDKWF